MSGKVYKGEIHRTCEFEFNNGTFIRISIPAMDDEDFDKYFKIAKELSWNGDESIGRGRLKSFTVGEYVQVCVSIRAVKELCGILK